jgi:hypothetical protein
MTRSSEGSIAFKYHMTSMQRRFRNDGFPLFAYADEILAATAIALCCAVAVHGLFLFGMGALGSWIRWMGMCSAVVAPCLAVGMAVLIFRMRRRPWTPDGTLLLLTVGVAFTGWFFAEMGLAQTAKSDGAIGKSTKLSCFAERQQMTAVCAAQDAEPAFNVDGRLTCLSRTTRWK